MTNPANMPEHDVNGATVQPKTDQAAYAPEGSAYHPATPEGVEGDAYAEGGAEYDALQRAERPVEDVPLPAAGRPDDDADDERQYSA